MKLFELRKNLKLEFGQHGIDDVDVDFIISEVLQVSRTELILIEEVDDEQIKKIRSACDMRLENIPIEKIFKKSYFYGLEFKVDDNVLSPRPESEMIVDIALKYIKDNSYNTVLDMCTGSGCLAISIKKNSNVIVTAVDISTKALAIAKQNAKTNNVEVEFIKSNMFEKVENKFDLIVSNPPYIDSEEIENLDEEVKEHDPHLALDGGELGLKYYNIIHDNLRKHLNDNGMLILEIGDEQKDLLISLFNDFNLVESLKDYSGNDRILVFTKQIRSV